MGDVLVLRACHCGRPARGIVPDNDTPPGAPYSVMTHHACRQCSPEHCQLGSPGEIEPDDGEDQDEGLFLF